MGQFLCVNACLHTGNAYIYVSLFVSSVTLGAQI